jgi:hypothetical protein
LISDAAEEAWMAGTKPGHDGGWVIASVRWYQLKHALLGITIGANLPARNRGIWELLFGRTIEAITREKQIKAGSRTKKLALIEALNRDWKDLYESLI